MSQKQDAHLAQLHATLRQRAVDELTESDAELLGWRAAGWSYGRIARVLGIHRSRAHQRVEGAKRRQWVRDVQAGLISVERAKELLGMTE